MEHVDGVGGRTDRSAESRVMMRSKTRATSLGEGVTATGARKKEGERRARGVSGMQREVVVVVVVVPWCWPGRAADDVRLRRYGPGIRGTSYLSLHVWTGAWIIEPPTVTRTLSDATTTLC